MDSLIDRTWGKLPDVFREEEDHTLEASWWVFDAPEIKNLFDVGKESIQDLMDKFKAKIITIDDKPKIFEARYEVIKYQGEFKHPEAKLRDMDNPIGWADFLGGFPYGVAEIMALLSESTKPKEYPVEDGTGAAAAPVPDDIFGGYDEKQTAYNYLFIEENWCDPISDGMEELDSPKWWQRVNFPEPKESQKWPKPGEFVALGIRMFPDKPWGDQRNRAPSYQVAFGSTHSTTPGPR